MYSSKLYCFNLSSAATWCNSIYGFASVLSILIGNTSFAAELKICTMATGIKKHKSIIRKK